MILINDSVRRALRTLIQIGTVTALIALWNGLAPEHALDPGQVSALTAFGTLAVSWLQNSLEDKGAIPGLMKGPGTTPIIIAPAPEAVSNAMLQQELIALATAIADLRQPRHPPEPFSRGPGFGAAQA